MPVEILAHHLSLEGIEIRGVGLITTGDERYAKGKSEQSFYPLPFIYLGNHNSQFFN